METDTLDEVLTWAEHFRKAQLPFMIVGAFSVAVHGLARMSSDIDLVVHLPFTERARVAELLRTHGVRDIEERVDPQWGKRLAADLPSGLVLEIFFTPPNPVHDREYARRVEIDIDGRSIPFQSAEDLVLRKLVNTRLRRGLDYDDAVGVIGRQGDRLDVDYLRAHAGFYRVGELLERAIQDAGEADGRTSS